MQVFLFYWIIILNDEIEIWLSLHIYNFGTMTSIKKICILFGSYMKNEELNYLELYIDAFRINLLVEDIKPWIQYNNGKICLYKFYTSRANFINITKMLSKNWNKPKSSLAKKIYYIILKRIKNCILKA